jgi:hypothetical protein
LDTGREKKEESAFKAVKKREGNSDVAKYGIFEMA